MNKQSAFMHESRESLRTQSERKLRVIFWVLTAITLWAFTAPAPAATGRTNGSFSVNSTGEANYSIPIWAPPGPKGVQPNLALTYNSRQDSGIVGVGWSLSGLGAISRCTATYAQDAAPAPITLTNSDVFCLNGARLRLTSGTYGSSGSTYQTEIANFQNVTANGSAGNGPAYFTVKDRNGVSYQYGNGGNSQVLANGTTASKWLLNQVSDPSGNTMTIAYTTATGDAVPATISWTPSAYGSATYNYTMQFAYGVNVDQSSTYGYVAGTPIVNTNLLGSITINYSGSTVKKYVLSYTQSATTSRNELTQVKECADSAATNCLLPTNITYQSGQAGVSTTSTTVVTDSMTFLRTHYDIDGNGYTDLVYCGSSGVTVVFGSASGYGAPVTSTVPCGGFYGDFRGTGRDGILANNGGTWYYYLWNGSSFSGVSTGLAYDSTAAQYAVADVNGDGLPDLVSLYQTVVTTDTGTYVTGQINTRLNTSSGGSASFSASATTAYSITGKTGVSMQMDANTDAQIGPMRSFDFNGDGRQDLSLEVVTKNTLSCTSCVYTTTTYELISTGTTFTGTAIASASGSSYIPVAFLDFNSDACTDYLTAGKIYVSGCNGSVTGTINVASSVIGAMDWDGDGRTDVLVQNGSTIGVYLSTGVGLSSLVSTSVPYSSSNLYLALDANGDGLDDLSVWIGAKTTSLTTTIAYFPHNATGQPPDLLSSITDGYLNSASPTYVSLTHGSYTPSTDAVYPYVNYNKPLYVVNQVTLSDPSSASGGTYQQTFSYNGGWMNLQGRGFSGFAGLQKYDSRSGLWELGSFSREFPYAGMITGMILSQNSAGTLPVTNVAYTLATATLDGTANNQRYFPYASNVTTRNYELGGTKNGNLISTTSNTSTFDSYGNSLTVTSTVTDNDSTSPYVGQTWTTAIANTRSPDTTNWCLSLLTQTQVVYSGSNVTPSVTRTKQFTPDTIKCRNTQTVTEPGNTTYAVTETFGFDNFGNINSDTVTGVSMTARQTTASWGTTGQVPLSVTNALGQTTQQNYDFNFVLINSQTDPNGVNVSSQYDAFGRKSTQSRPDGTKTIWTYNDCASSGGCLLGTHALTVSATVYNADNTVQTDGSTYYDQVDRPLIATSRALASGSYTRNEVRYDSLGRVAQRAIPCSWSTVGTICSYWVTNTYDALGRITQSQRPISASNSTLQTATVAYQGDAVITTDPQGKTSTKINTAVGKLGQSIDHAAYRQTFSYDAFGTVVGITDSLGNTLFTASYDYGIAPLQRDATDMDLDLSTAAGQHRHFTYDALGELTGWSDAKGQSSTQTYDALSRPLIRTEPDLTTTWTWGSTAASHNIGKLQNLSANGYLEAYAYDAQGRLSGQTVTIPSDLTYTYGLTYNSNTGLLDTLTYPVSTSSYQLKLSYTYQNALLQKVSDFNAGTVYWQANSTNARGQVTQEALGNGVVTNRSFDAVTGWMGSVTSGVSGTAALQNESYLYDEVGNVTQRQNNNAGLSENFYYDDLYRLDHSSLNGTVNLQMGYSASGNITSRSDVAGGAAWTYDATHKHAVTQAGSSVYTYTYDANGNAISRNGLGITWTSYNHPLVINNSGSGESVQFSYNQDHERWSAVYTGSSGVETTFFIGKLLEKVVQSGTTDYRHYIYAAGTKVAVYSRTSAGVNTLHYIREDQQGSVASLLNSDGTSYVKESFTAFGVRRSACTWSGQPTNGALAKISAVTRHGYTWQTALGAMGLNDMNGRIQDAVTGRFLSADPIIHNPANTQNFNRYSYVNNNPLSFVDPTGFQDKKPVDGDPPPTLNGGLGSGGEGAASSEGGSFSRGIATTICSEGHCITNYEFFIDGNFSDYLWLHGGPNPPLLWTAGGNGVSGGRSGSAPPPHAAPAAPPPKGTQKQYSCPKGTWASIGSALVHSGEDLTAGGEVLSSTGFISLAVGSGATLVGQAEVGAPLIAGGFVLGSFGGLVSLTGLAVQGLGGIILSTQGNSQPLQATVAHGVQAAVENAVHLPDGAPSPIAPFIDQDLDNMEAGSDPCPQ